MLHLLFTPQEKSQAKWTSLGTELYRLGGDGADMGKVKMLFLPASKCFFLVCVCVCLAWVLQLLNWSLEFSERYFDSNIIALCVKGQWLQLLFYLLIDITLQYLLMY